MVQLGEVACNFSVFTLTNQACRKEEEEGEGEGVGDEQRTSQTKELLLYSKSDL